MGDARVMIAQVLALGWLLDGGAAAPPAWAVPPAAPPSSGSYDLRPDGDEFVYDAGPFRARVAVDGRVRFEDTRFRPRLALPLPTPHAAGTPTLEGALRDKLGRRKRARPVE